MAQTEWNKVSFQEFINKFNKNIVIKIAPTILYSKKDKEPEAFYSLIAFFFITGGLFIYISLSILFNLISFSLVLFLIIIITGAIIDVFLILNYIRSNISIKPIECWIEIFQATEKYYCFSYYPIFTGKSLPNKAKNIIYKLYQNEILKSKIDVTQIEVYLKTQNDNTDNLITMGYFFQNGEGIPFKSEKINRNAWRFFPYEKTKNDNFLATANWDHQYEWREDLELDYDKLHSYAPWVIKKWDEESLKPITDEFKRRMNWDLRRIESLPKLKPWMGTIETQTYESFKSYKDLQIVNEVIEKIVGPERKIKKLKDIKDKLLEIKAYFRDMIL
ncbi:MAG: hypothetical protein ACFFD5_11850 [Candidatus Thorarchaeota archaeon]